MICNRKMIPYEYVTRTVDELTDIACEHVTWRCRRGDSFAQIIASVGRVEPPTDDGAIAAIAKAQRALDRPKA